MAGVWEEYGDEDDVVQVSAYYNEIDPFAAAWLRELIKTGEDWRSAMSESEAANKWLDHYPAAYVEGQPRDSAELARESPLACPKCGCISVNVRNSFVGNPPEKTTALCYKSGCMYIGHVSEFVVQSRLESGAGWIPVSERLPEQEVSVLIAMSERYQVARRRGRWFEQPFGQTVQCWSVDDVTHWRELPQPPSGLRRIRESV